MDAIKYEYVEKRGLLIMKRILMLLTTITLFLSFILPQNNVAFADEGVNELLEILQLFTVGIYQIVKKKKYGVY